MSGLGNHRLKFPLDVLSFSPKICIALSYSSPLICSRLLLAYLIPNSCMHFLSFVGCFQCIGLKEQDKFISKLFQ